MKRVNVLAVAFGVLSLMGAASLPPATAAPGAKSAKSIPVKAKVKSKAAPGKAAPGKASASKASASKASASTAQARTFKARKVKAGKAQAVRPSGARTDRGGAATPVAARAGRGLFTGLEQAQAVPASLHPSPAEFGSTPSIGEAIGLHRIPDPLALRSAVALVVDARNGDILYQKNAQAVLPIASITKVMMAMVVFDAHQSLRQTIIIDDSDRDTERLSSSRLPVGSTLTRAQLLQLALMSSENRAASALARSYPGGLAAFVAAANRKAAAIGMRDSIFMDGTGLSSANVSTARDLAVMVAHASRYPLINGYSTASELSVSTAHGARVFRTTNRMVGSGEWNLSLQKTGYISESGNCLVMRGEVDGRPMIMVLLDSYGRYSRLGDAQRIRRWLEG